MYPEIKLSTNKLNLIDTGKIVNSFKYERGKLDANRQRKISGIQFMFTVACFIQSSSLSDIVFLHPLQNKIPG